MGHVTIKRPVQGRLDVVVLGLVTVKQLTNLKSLWSPATKIRKATKNAEIEVVWGYGSLKVIGNIAIL